MNLKQKYGMLKLKIANYLKAKPKSSKILFASIGLAISIASATYIPFMFWGQRGSTSAGDITITTNTTITDANYSTYENKNVTINTGITVTVQATVPLTWYGLTMVGTASITPAACTTTVCYPLRLTISTDATIPASASITADGKGYIEGTTSTNYARTYGNTTSGASYFSGGSHGGYGGSYPGYTPNELYGSVTQPVDVGSGGGSHSTSYNGTAGGGAIKILINGTLNLAGSISANGLNPVSQAGGCGAGGSVWVSASAISGSGTIKANGGSHSSYCISGGGGGRVAVYYGGLTTFNPGSTTYVQALPGAASSYSAGAGTIFSKSASQVNGDILISGTTISTRGSTRFGAFGNVNSVSSSTLNMVVSADPYNMKMGLSLPGSTLRPDITQSNVISLTSTTATSLTASGSLTSLTSAGKSYCVTDYETTFDNVKIEGNQALRVGCLTVTGTLTATGTASVTAFVLDVGSASIAGALTVLDKTTAATGGTFTLGSGANFTAKSFTGDTLSLNTASMTMTTDIISGPATLASSNVSSMTFNVTGSMSLTGATTVKFKDSAITGALTLAGTSKITAHNSSITNIYPITISAASLTLPSGTSIDADGKGYFGGDTATYYGRTLGNTQTGAAYYYTGGTHGGYGGSAGYQMNEPYGSVTEPSEAGSGGGSYSSSYPGTNGGGAIKLTISGAVTLGGAISANGVTPVSTVGGCGAGGSVWLSADSISGAGTIKTNGGGSPSYCYSGGGGGRIAVYYNSLTTFNPSSTTYVQSYGGAGTAYQAGSGTIYSKAASQTNGDLFIAGTTVSSYGSTRWGAFGPVSSVSGSTVNMTTSADPRSMKPMLSLTGKTLRPDISLPATVSISSYTTSAVTAVSSLSGLTSAGKSYCVTDFEAVFDNVRIEGNQQVRVGCMNITGTLSMPGTGRLDAYTLDVATTNISGAVTVNVLDKTTNPSITIGSGATYTTKYFAGTSFTAGASTVNVTGTLDTTTLNLTGTTLSTTSNLTALSAVVLGTTNLTVGANFAAGSADISSSTVNVSGNMAVTGNLNISSSSTINVTATLSAGTTTIASSNVNALTINITGDMGLSGTTIVKLQDSTVSGALNLTNTAKITSHTNGTNVFPIRITAGSMSVPSGTMVDAEGLGYIAGTTSTNYARTFGNTTAGASYFSGGSHGGYGGNYPGYAPNEQYGSVLEPTDFGSGGGSHSTSYNGTNGGGVIKITVTGTLTLGGTINASGTSPVSQAGGCGAGGSVWVNAGTISGSGTMKANGGSHSSYCISGGGGGRVAVYYGSLTTFNPGSTTYVQALPGFASSYPAGAGTIFSKGTAQTNGDLLVSGTTVSGRGSTRFGAFGLVNSVSTNTLNMQVSADPFSMKTGLSLPGLTLRPDVTQSATLALTSTTATSLTAVSSLAAMTSAGKAYCVTNYETTFDNLKIEGNQTVRTGCLTVAGTLSMPGTGRLDTYLLDSGTTNLAGAVTVNTLEKMTTTPGTFTLGTGSTLSAKSFAADVVSLTGSTVNITNEFTSGALTVGTTTLNVGTTLTAGTTSLASSPTSALTINITGDLAISGTSVVKLQDATVSGAVNLLNTAKITSHTPTASVIYPVRITANSMSLPSGTSIDADGKGYLGGDTATYYGRTLGNTQTGAAYYYTGGTHGGYGGNAGYQMNEPYGSVLEPIEAGAGGGSYSGSYPGTNGGGPVKLTIAGTLSLGGSISANGFTPVSTVGGCGAGGSVWISAGSVSGAGTVKVNGGGSASYCYSGGGGGRIAIYYGSLTTFNPSSSTYVQSYGGAGTSYQAGSGTVYSKSTSQTNGDLFIAGTTVSSYGATRWGAFGTVSSVSSGTLTMNAGIDPRSLKASLSLAGKTLVPDVTQSTTVSLSSSTTTTVTSATSLSALTSASKNFCVNDFEAVFDNVRIEGNQTTRVGCLKITGTLTVPGTARLDAYILDINTSNISGAATIIATEKILNPVLVLGSGSVYTTKNFIGTDLTATGATVTVTDSVSTNNLTLTSTTMNVTNNVTVLNDFQMTSSTLTVGGSLSSTTATLSGSTLNLTSGSMNISGALNISASSNVTVAATITAGPTTIASSNVSAPTFIITGDMALSGTAVVKLQDATVSGALNLTNTAKITSLTNGTNTFPIRITSNSMSVPAGTMIDAEGLGYIAGTTSTNYARTYGNTTAGASYFSGGSHGGYGGNYPGYAPNEQYGSVLQPIDFGSGGGSHSTSYNGTNGGGSIKLIVTATLTLNGTINASGTSPVAQAGGCGAGGSVWVSAGTISGSGTMKANGGSHSSYCISGGGGGRVAVYYGSLTTFNPQSTTYVQALPGLASSYPAGAGTIYSKSTAQTNGDLLVSGTTVSGRGSTRFGAFGLVNSVSTNTLNMQTSADPFSMKMGLSLPGLTLRPDVTQSATLALASTTATSLTAVSSLAAMTSAGKAYCVTNYETTFDNVTIEGNQAVRVGCLNITNLLSMPGTGKLDSYLLDVTTGTLSGAITLNVLEKMTMPASGSVTFGAGSVFTSKYFVGDTFTMTSTTATIGSDFTSGNLTASSSTFNVANSVTAKTTSLASSAVSALTYSITGDMGLSGTSVVKMQTTTVTGDLNLSNTAKILAHTPTATNIYPITITAANMTVPSGTSIDADGKGYLGGDTATYYGRTLGNTQTGAAYYYTGGTHGGYGGSAGYQMNEPYGSVTEPAEMGAGGGSYSGSYPGTNGGGAIKLTISGALSLGGAISANGATPVSTVGGCGAGGSVWISAGSVSGAGTVKTNGGGSASYCYSGGGGGRIAVYYGSLTTFNPSSSTYVQSYGGAGTSYQAGSGTIYSKATSQTNGDLFIAGTTVSSYGATRWGAFGAVSSVSGSTLTMNSGADPRSLRGGVSLVGKKIRPDVSQSTTANITASNATTITVDTSLAALTSAAKNFCVTDFEAVFDNVRIEGNQTTRVGCLTVTGTLTVPGTARLDSYILDINTSNISGAGTITSTERINNPVVNLGSGATYTAKNFIGTDFTATSATVTISDTLSTNNLTLTSSTTNVTNNVTVVNNFALSGGTLTTGGNITAAAATITGATLTASVGSMSVSGALNISSSSTVNIATTLAAGTTTIASSNVNALTINITGDMSLSGTTIVKLQDSTVSGALNLTNTAKITSHTNGTNLFPIRITAGSMSVPTGTMIDAEGLGYIAGTTSTNYGRTYGNTTSGASYFSGGSHGGYGGNYPGYAPNEQYGSVLQPTDFGSGGGSHSTSYNGTNGGGSIKLIVTGTLSLGGTINASGTSPVSQAGGCGAGGSVWVNAGAISGSGTMKANGGSHSSYCISGGGGGRVAVYYGSLTTFNPQSTTYVQALPGLASSYPAGAGTIYSKSTVQTNGDLLISGTTVSGRGSTRFGAFGLVNSVSTNTLNMQTSADPFSMKMGLSIPGTMLRPDVSQSNVVAVTSSTATALVGASSLAALTAAGKAFCVTDYETAFDNLKIEGNQTVRTGCLTVSGTLAMPGTARLDTYLLDLGAANLSGTVTLNNLEKITTTSGSFTLGSGSSVSTKSFAADVVNLTGSTVNVTNDFTSGALTVGTTTLNVGTTLTATGATSLASSPTSALTINVTGDLAISGTSVVKLQDATVSGALNLLNTAKITSHTPTASVIYPVRITAGSLSVPSGTSIDADGKGYLGGDTSTYYARTLGNTQTGAAYYYTGGSHGGYGGNAGYQMNELYGSVLQPADAGSGGGSYSGSYPGTNGGGAVKLTIAGALTLGGAISANGATPVSTVGGCGAGGSIWIAADSISGAGTLKTNGGSSASYCYSGGGGGRIAVYYTTLTTFNPMSTTYVQSYGGAGTSYQAGSGTIFSKATSQANGSLYISGTTVSTYGSTRWGAFGVVGSVSGSNLTMSTGADPRSQKMGLSLTGYTLRPDTTQSNVVALTSSTPTVLTAASSLAGLTSATKNFCVTDYESTFDNVKIEGNQNVRVGCMTVLTSYSNTSSGTMNSYLLTPP